MRATLRICLWILVGATVTLCWTLFAMLAHPRPDWGHWTVVTITVPATALLHTRPATYYEVMIVNSAIYGLVGLALEPLFRLHGSASLKSH